MRREASLAVLALGLAACGGDAGPAGDARPAQEAGPRAWRAHAPSPFARTEVAAARVGDAVYVAGGFIAPGGATTRRVARYDLRRDRWRRVAAMPVGLNHAAAVAYRGDLYVVGGYTQRRGLGRETGALLRYDPARDRWTRLRSAPSRRGAHAAGVIGDRLYVAGGAEDARPLATLEIYDFRTRRWSRGPSMAVAREHLAATVHRGALYVLAGRASGQGNFTTAERYLPSRRRWQRLPDMAKARGGIASATVNGQVVVVGGEEGAGTIAEVESFAPATRRWRPLADLATPRHGLGAVAYGGRVYTFEGGPTPGLDYSRAVESLAIGPRQLRVARWRHDAPGSD